MVEKKFQLIIVGVGVSGAATAYLSTYTNVKDILVLEQYRQPGRVNSDPMNNAQTSHDGSTETNYDLKHALEVQKAARPLRRYADRKNDPQLSAKRTRMVLAVGAKEVAELKARFSIFSPHYPDLREIGREELAILEPKVMEGRDPNEPVCAHVSTEGYIINYQQLSVTLLSDARRSNPQLEVHFNSPLKSVRRENGEYIVETEAGVVYRSLAIVFCTGAYSLYHAHMLGYGLDYAILPVAGSFYSGGKLLNGKVYRVQIPGLPFAAAHGDVDILNMDDTRFGPTVRFLWLMERHLLRTAPYLVRMYMRSPLRGILSLFKILVSKQLIGYALENIMFDLPFGKVLFARTIRPIIPTIRAKDLTLRKGAGGIRPQIVNLKTKELEMGNKIIEGDGCVFVTTPSPGASVCFGNAEDVIKRVVKFLGNESVFDQDRYDRENM